MRIRKSYQNKKFSFIHKANNSLVKIDYEIRGSVSVRAFEIQEAINRGNSAYQFDKLTALNIGNPQALKQLPLTFPREVIACFLANHSNNKDAYFRAHEYKKSIENAGNYTPLCGIKHVRKNVSKFISKRDNIYNISYKDILMTNGATSAIKATFEALINSDKDAVMVPIPNFPLYPCVIKLLKSNIIGYELNEKEGWTLDFNIIKSQYISAYESGLHPKIFVIVNPGNPTGNVFSKKNLEDLIEFCYNNKMVIFADEVYQKNVYNHSKQFLSVRSIVNSMPYPYCKTIVFSCHSTSKGYYGECGLRGGYLDTYNCPDLIYENILKSRSFDICPNIVGQLSMDLLINPPNTENASDSTINLYNVEVSTNYELLKSKSQFLSKILNSIPGFSCQTIDGALYAFPSIKFPRFRIDEAITKDMEPDMLYVLALLEETGIMCVPGSAFGQKLGTYHIRITNLLNPPQELESMLNKVKEFTTKYFRTSE